MVENPLVSIIINCYNGEEHLREAMNSVYAQTYTNWEIIFWDNCSTDTSAEIAKSYGEKVIYYKAEINKPLGEARNYALAKANGKYLAFIDCDDIWSDDKLEKQVDLMEENPNFILCYSSIEYVYLNGDHFRDVYTIFNSGYIFKELLLQYDINILTAMIRKDLLIATGLNFDPFITASEEYCLFMQLASHYPIGVIKDIQAKYRINPESLTSKSLPRLGIERRYTLDQIVKNHPELKVKYAKEFKEAYARGNYYDARWHMSTKNNWKAFKCMIAIAHLSIRYFILAFVTLLPGKVWEQIHLKLRNRT